MAASIEPEYSFFWSPFWIWILILACSIGVCMIKHLQQQSLNLFPPQTLMPKLDEEEEEPPSRSCTSENIFYTIRSIRTAHSLGFQLREEERGYLCRGQLFLTAWQSSWNNQQCPGILVLESLEFATWPWWFRMAAWSWLGSSPIWLQRQSLWSIDS